MKISKSYRVFTIGNTIFLTLFTLCTLYPVIHVLMASFSDGNALVGHTGLLLRPLEFTFDAYQRVFKNRMIMGGYMNTLFVVVVALMINIVLTSMGAYFTSRKYITGRNAVMFFMMFTMYFSGGIIPTYFVVRNIGLYDSLLSLILPSAIATYNLIILRTAFASVPDSLEEAAQIDGAGHFRILWTIVFPLSKATVAVIALYYLVGHWNGWFYAMIYLADRNKYPLQLVLREILIANDTSSMSADVMADNAQSVGEAIKYAVIVISTAPMLILYPFLQKFFAKGVMIGAVKG